MTKNTTSQTQLAFEDIFNVFDYADQQKTLRLAVRKEAKNVLQIAKDYVKSTKDGKKNRSLSEATAGIEEGLHHWVYPDKGGSSLIVTPVPHGRKGYHINRQGLEKPVLMWAETGTADRRRGPKTEVSYKYVSKLTGKEMRRYSRVGAKTGRMPEYGFIEKAEQSAYSGSENRIFDNFEKSLVRKARRAKLL